MAVSFFIFWILNFKSTASSYNCIAQFCLILMRVISEPLWLFYGMSIKITAEPFILFIIPYGIHIGVLPYFTDEVFNYLYNDKAWFGLFRGFVHRCIFFILNLTAYVKYYCISNIKFNRLVNLCSKNTYLPLSSCNGIQQEATILQNIATRAIVSNRRVRFVHIFSQ